MKIILAFSLLVSTVQGAIAQAETKSSNSFGVPQNSKKDFRPENCACKTLANPIIEDRATPSVSDQNASYQLVNDPTEINLAAGFIKCSEAADINVFEDGKLITLNEGQMLIATKAPVLVQTQTSSIQLNKDCVAIIETLGRTMQVHILHESNGVGAQAFIAGSPFSLGTGQELVLARSATELQRLTEMDAIQRRKPRIFAFNDGSRLLACEFAPITLMKSHPVLKDLVHSHEPSHKDLVQKLIKTAACLQIVTYGHGRYMPIAPAIKQASL